MELQTLLVQVLVHIVALGSTSTDVCVVYSFDDRHSQDILSEILVKLQSAKTFTIYLDRFCALEHCNIFVVFAQNADTFRYILKY